MHNLSNQDIRRLGPGDPPVEILVKLDEIDIGFFKHAKRDLNLRMFLKRVVGIKGNIYEADRPYLQSQQLDRFLRTFCGWLCLMRSQSIFMSDWLRTIGGLGDANTKDIQITSHGDEKYTPTLALQNYLALYASSNSKTSFYISTMQFLS
jgi:hypothetical protein